MYGNIIFWINDPNLRTSSDYRTICSKNHTRYIPCPLYKDFNRSDRVEDQDRDGNSYDGKREQNTLMKLQET